MTTDPTPSTTTARETTVTETQPASETPDNAKIGAFADLVFPFWEDAMDRLFSKVEDQARHAGLTYADVTKALNRGYGYDFGEAWTEWVEEGQA